MDVMDEMLLVIEQALDQVYEPEELEVGRIYEWHRFFMEAKITTQVICVSTIYEDDYGYKSIVVVQWPGLKSGKRLRLYEVGIEPDVDDSVVFDKWLVRTDRTLPLIEVNEIIQKMDWHGPGTNPLGCPGGF